MQEPKYVLKTTERTAKRVKKYSPFIDFCAFSLWVIILFILFFSLVLRINPFAEAPYAIGAIILVAVVLTLIGLRTEYVEYHLEMRFYDDRLALYYPKKYFKGRKTRMEYIEIRYADISKCTYDEKYSIITIYGNETMTYCNYNADGSVSTEHGVNKQVRNVSFRTDAMKDIDIVREIETHSPIKITIENSTPIK